MTNGVLSLRLKLTEGDIVPVGHEHWIVAKPAFAARWPHQSAVNLTRESLNMAVGPCQGQDAREMRTSVGGTSERVLDAVHGEAKIFFGAGPAGRMNAGLATEGCYHEARIVG